VDIMDKEQMNNAQLAREHTVYDYLDSLENGNIDGIIQSIQQAVYDAPLDQMLFDAHQAYFQEEGLEEQFQRGIQTSTPAQSDHPAPLSFSPRIRPEQRKRRVYPAWVNTLAAVLVIGVLVGSFAALLIWRQAMRSGTPSPGISTCTAFKLYPAPDHGKMSDLLTSVTVVAPGDAWAVGYSVVPQVSLAPESTLVQHWNGQRWQIVASPNGKPGNTVPGNGILHAVAAASENDIWAVGSYQARSGGVGDQDDNPLIEHWNGSIWQVVPSPTMPASRGPHSPSGNGKLYGVAAVSSSDIWAVGEALMPDGNTQLPLLEHWDGKQWSVISSFPRTGWTVLNGLAAISARNIWVAGQQYTPPNSQGLLTHWDGSQWKLFTFPDVFQFKQLSANGPSDIWAIGMQNDASGSPLVEHWDGKKWSGVSLPQLSSAAEYTVTLSGIAAVTARNVWAVGTLRINGMEEQFLVLHWNGNIWQRVKVQVPQPLEHNPANAIAIGYNQTWIVGDQGGLKTLIQGCA
jgi:hypothetical protein